MDKQTYLVKGMNCGGCAYVIQKQLLRLKGVKRALVHFDKREVKIEYDHNKISESEMIQSISPFGYTLSKAQRL